LCSLKDAGPNAPPQEGGADNEPISQRAPSKPAAAQARAARGQPSELSSWFVQEDGDEQLQPLLQKARGLRLALGTLHPSPRLRTVKLRQRS
jgi:hypothetical protein